MIAAMVKVEEVGVVAARRLEEPLAELLHACVHAGANVNFVMPFERDDAARFWTSKIWPVLESRERRMLVAWDDGRLVGTVQLILAMPPNQRHRGEVAKMLVHPEARRRGIGRRLMDGITAVAIEEKRTLLTLDTAAGSAGEKLYRSMGFVGCEPIPGFARHPLEDRLEAALYMYKQI